MNRIKVMFYADSWKATSGYSRVVRELATRLSLDEKFDIYVQQIVSTEPAYTDGQVKILPVFGQRGTDIFLNSIVNNIRMIHPDVFIPICDPFLLTRDGISKIEFGNNKLLTYIPLDSIGIPDLSADILDKCDHIFVMSHDGKKQLDAEGYTNSSVLYHGVNLKDFAPIEDKEKRQSIRDEFGYSSTDEVFLAIGRNFPRKRPMRLLEAIAIHNRDNPETKAKFLLHISDFTKDPYNLETFISRMETKYNVVLDNIKFTAEHRLGQGLDEGEFLKLYQLADYYITSTSGEGFGLPTIEAMAAKLPVIIPENSTGMELSGYGEHAYLVSNDGFQNTGFGTQQPLVDVEELSFAITLVMGEDNTERVEKAYKFIQKECNWDLIAIQMQRQIEDEYRK